MGQEPLVLASLQVRRRRLVDLDRHPDALDGGFRPAAEIIGERIEADLCLRLAVARRLAAMSRPLVALVPSHAQPIAVDWRREQLYTVVPRSFVQLLAQVRGEQGAVPRWLQHLVLHQLFDYLRADSALYTSTAALPAALTDPFHEALDALLSHIDEELLTGLATADVSEEMRLALLLGARRRRGHARPSSARDAGRGLVRVSYLFAGDPPAHHFTLSGSPVEPAHHKIRSIDVLGRTLLREYIAWLPDEAIVAVDASGEVALSRVRLQSRLARYGRIAIETPRVVPRFAGRAMGDLRIRLAARRRTVQRRYRGAWLLMDRDTGAQDNAEHIYRYLRKHEPDVNAWFVLAADSPDRARLQREGFRLLDFGSAEHFAALRNCAHLISSQIDSYVVKPFRKHLLGAPGWRFTFLQHGVIKDDLSRWLNGKPVDLFITSTPDEQRSIVTDGSRYVFTDLEVVMTGLARHDRLLTLAAARTPTRLVIMPTWRRELLGEQLAGNRRALSAGFWNSDYANGWRELLESDRLRSLCEHTGWQLTFVPHPNMQDFLDTSPLPADINAHRFSEIDVQQVLADAAVVVTDYSSLATEAAYLCRPVVYYQFDREEFFAGGHVYRRGTWSYEQQGFGPITQTAAGALAALEQIASQGLDPTYAARMRRTFPFRDGRCCERIVAAIRTLPGHAARTR